MIQKSFMFAIALVLITSCAFSSINERHTVAQIADSPEFIIKKDTATNEFKIVNRNNKALFTITTSTIRVSELLIGIENSALSDKMLILRVLNLQPTDEAKLKELIALAKTYKEINAIFMAEVNYYLRQNFSEQEIKELLTK